MFIICFGGMKFSIIFSQNYVLGFKSVWFFVLVLNDIYDGNAQIFFVLRVARRFRIFSVCDPSLVGAYYLHPPDARAIFLHNNLLCNGTCSVTGAITYKRKTSFKT